MVRHRFIELLRSRGYSYRQAKRLYNLLVSVLLEVFLTYKRLEFRRYFVLRLSSQSARFIRNPRNGMEYFSSCVYFSCKAGSKWRQRHEKVRSNSKAKKKGIV